MRVTVNYTKELSSWAVRHLVFMANDKNHGMYCDDMGRGPAQELIDAGLVQETWPNPMGTSHTYWVLTDEGLRFCEENLTKVTRYEATP